MGTCCCLTFPEERLLFWKLCSALDQMCTICANAYKACVLGTIAFRCVSWTVWSSVQALSQVAKPTRLLAGVPNLIIHLGVDLLRAEQIWVSRATNRTLYISCWNLCNVTRPQQKGVQSMAGQMHPVPEGCLAPAWHHLFLAKPGHICRHHSPGHMRQSLYSPLYGSIRWVANHRWAQVRSIHERQWPF